MLFMGQDTLNCWLPITHFLGIGLAALILLTPARL